MSRTEEELRHAADRSLLRDLLGRYAWEIDHGSPEGWASTFAPDGVFEVPDVGMWVEGTETLEAFARDLQTMLPGVHHVMSGFVFELSGDRATGRCALNQFLARPDGVHAIQQGWYEDVYVYGASGWKIQHRRAFTQEPASTVAGKVGEYTAAYYAETAKYIRS